MKTETDYQQKFRHLYHEMGRLSDRLADAHARQSALTTCLQSALTLAAAEQTALEQLFHQAYNALTEADDL